MPHVLKYTNKGKDRADFQLDSNDNTDEISDYHNYRYLGSNEAAATLLGLKTCGINPNIVKLNLHLPNEQTVFYNEQTLNSNNINQNVKLSTLEAFFALCVTDRFAGTLLYHQIPEYYVLKSRSWQRRVRGGRKITLDDGSYVIHANTIGRLFTVSPRLGELYFMRLLLVSVCGPTSFEDLRSFEGVASTTFQDTCRRRGLLDNDEHLIMAMQEIADTGSVTKLKDLFIVIVCCTLATNISDIWHQFADDLCEDILHAQRVAMNDYTLQVTPDMRSRVLIELNRRVLLAGCRSLASHGLQIPSDQDTPTFPTLMERESQNIDLNEETSIAHVQVPLLNQDGQQFKFNTILRKIENSEDGHILINASAGAGKTFLLTTILAQLRSNGHFVIATAASSCAALIIRNARTVHSTFKVPLNIRCDSTCAFHRGSEPISPNRNILLDCD